MREYSEEEIKYLKENFLLLSNKELAGKLDRSVDGIASKLKDLDLIRRSMNPYTEEEKKYIRDNVGKKTITEIADDLGRTQGGVSKFVSKFRINKIRKKNKTYLENIDNDVVPFFSKSDNYFEIMQKMKVNDSFEFPESDKAIVSTQKYVIINQQKEQGKNPNLFTIRKTAKREGIQFCRIWRLL